MSYQLVIAEKPSVARSIAAVIGATEKQNGPFVSCGIHGYPYSAPFRPFFRKKTRYVLKHTLHSAIYYSSVNEGLFLQQPEFCNLLPKF